MSAEVPLDSDNTPDKPEPENSPNTFAVSVLILFGFLLLVYLFSKPIKHFMNSLRLKTQTKLMTGYWNNVIQKHKETLLNFFQPLYDRKKEISENADEKQRNLDILEIGVGDGANFAYYPDGCNVYAVEPEDIFEASVMNNLKKYPHLTLKKFYHFSAEDMSYIETGSIDAVVSTMCLCSVGDTEKVVSEVKRILRKGGVFIFWEHVLSTDNPRIKFFQWSINGLWKKVFGNCHLIRQTWKTVESAGFSFQKYSKINIDTMALISPTLVGRAIK